MIFIAAIIPNFVVKKWKCIIKYFEKVPLAVTNPQRMINSNSFSWLYVPLQLRSAEIHSSSAERLIFLMVHFVSCKHQVEMFTRLKTWFLLKGDFNQVKALERVQTPARLLALGNYSTQKVKYPIRFPLKIRADYLEVGLSWLPGPSGPAEPLCLFPNELCKSMGRFEGPEGLSQSVSFIDYCSHYSLLTPNYFPILFLMPHFLFPPCSISNLSTIFIFLPSNCNYSVLTCSALLQMCPFRTLLSFQLYFMSLCVSLSPHFPFYLPGTKCLPFYPISFFICSSSPTTFILSPKGFKLPAVDYHTSKHLSSLSPVGPISCLAAY